MKRIAKWLLGAAVALLLLVGAVALALEHWVGSEDFRGRVEQQASGMIGVPLQLGRITVNVWPVPAVALDAVQVRSRPALTLERIEARPSWPALLHGTLEIKTLVVRNAVLPEQAVTALLAALHKKQESGGRHEEPSTASRSGAALPQRALLEHVTWLPAKGNGSTIDAQFQLDPDGLPATARIEVREGRWQGARATVDRGQAGWNLHADIGGGTVQGKVQVQPGPKGSSIVEGQLQTSNVEVSALTAPSRTLTGRIEAHTTLHANIAGGASIADAMHSDTRFTVRNAVVHGLDLAQAVKTIGINRGGQTALDTLAGQIVTRGRTMELNNLVATSGGLSATGHVAMAPDRKLSGHVNVAVAGIPVGGALGVPLAVEGTLDAPSVTLTRGALIGAAIGTALAPGVGTGAGAKLGDTLGQSLRGLFGR
jgi:hypothetical protein